MFKYLLSSEINYSLLICDDAGPQYATNMRWEYIFLKNLRQVNSHEIYIVDPRMQINELDILKNYVHFNPDTRFFFRVADPYFEIYKDHFYYKFLFFLSNKKNVYLLSTYEPKEIVLDLKTLYENRLINLPYPYLEEREIHNQRRKKNKVIISGSINKDIYPYRSMIWLKAMQSILRIFFFSVLKHPGYIDINNNKTHTHSLIKHNFIQYLSNFKYMLLCPSRCYIEFLKFNECAYAGCIPVGEAPQSYPDKIQRLFLTIKPHHFFRDSIKIMFKEHNSESVYKFRTFLRETRSPDILNKQLKAFVDENTIYTS